MITLVFFVSILHFKVYPLNQPFFTTIFVKNGQFCELWSEEYNIGKNKFLLLSWPNVYLQKKLYYFA